jgi:hypothetical protein
VVPRRSASRPLPRLLGIVQRRFWPRFNNQRDSAGGSPCARAALRRDRARPCALAQARTHDGRRRNGDERAEQVLGVYGAPAERHGHLSRMRRPNQWTLADHGLHLAEPDVRPQPLINGQCSPNGLYGISTADRPHSALMLRARMTLPTSRFRRRLAQSSAFGHLSARQPHEHASGMELRT